MQRLPASGPFAIIEMIEMIPCKHLTMRNFCSFFLSFSHCLFLTLFSCLPFNFHRVLHATWPSVEIALKFGASFPHDITEGVTDVICHLICHLQMSTARQKCNTVSTCLSLSLRQPLTNTWNSQDNNDDNDDVADDDDDDDDAEDSAQVFFAQFLFNSTKVDQRRPSKHLY